MRNLIKRKMVDIVIVIIGTLICLVIGLIAMLITTDVSAEDKTTEVVIVEELNLPTLFPSNGSYLGEFKITAYCPCEECCNKDDGITATQTKATQGRTVAVDPTIIPYGTEIYFDGNTYVAEDCGGAIKGNRIDLYFDSHQEALGYGVQYHEVYLEVTDD